MLCQIPGISSVTALAIMEKYKTLPNLIKEISKNLPKSNVNILDEFLFVINKKVECLKNVNNAFLCNDKAVQKEISKKFIEQFLILKEAVISCEKKIPSSIEKLLGIKEYVKKMDPVVRVYQKSLGIKGIEKFDPFASICKIEGYNGKEEALYEEGGGGGKGKPLAEPTISPASAEAGAAAGKALELSVESLSTIEKLVEFAFSCEYKKPTYIIQRRVLRWDTHSLTPTKIYENNEIFGDFAKQDENYLKNQILYHSGTGLDKILNCPELRKIFCKPEESAFILECILTLKAEGENPLREIPGSFLCRYNENNQIYHRHFKEKIWGGNYDHLVEIYLGRDRTDTKEYEPGSEDGEVEGMGNVMARALENGNIYIGLKDHSLIEGYVILRNE